MSCGNNCDAERPDILRSNIHIGDSPCPDPPCEDCTDDCPVLPKECDCPYGHLSGGCVHYTGCQTFISEMNPGDTFDDMVIKIERIFDTMQKQMGRLVDRISDLESQVSSLKNSMADGQGCTNWT